MSASSGTSLRTKLLGLSVTTVVAWRCFSWSRWLTTSSR